MASELGERLSAACCTIRTLTRHRNSGQSIERGDFIIEDAVLVVIRLFSNPDRSLFFHAKLVTCS
jgi:hypothetical protein